MNRSKAVLLILAFTLLVILPIVQPCGTVLAQSTGYTIDKVDHEVDVMISGQIAVIDTIHVSGQVTDGFMIGLPYKYSADVLQALAYDDSHLYQMNLGVQLGDHSGFYGAEINFNGNSPSVFTVAFVLSNRLITQQLGGNYLIDFPAYPSLTQNVGIANVSLGLPSQPVFITISKDDGEVSGITYSKTNLPAYTYSVAIASLQESSGPLQITSVSSVDRQVTADPTGTVTSVDAYHIIDNSTSTLNSFIVALPAAATNVVIRDDFGRTLSSYLIHSSDGNILLANATLVTYLTSNQVAVIRASYNLPSAKIEGSRFTLENFTLFPNLLYFVDHATFTFSPPEGATIVTPQAASLDSSSTLTRQTLQDTLTASKNGISYIDYISPEQKTIQLSYDYNPVWISFRPTFWAAFLSLVGCVAVVLVRRRKPKEEQPYVPRSERATLKTSAPVAMEGQKGVELKTEQHISTESIKEFLEAYEDKKQLKAEIKALDQRAQKGKLPRRQYKVQRKAIEIRLESLDRSIARTKEMFLETSGYADVVRQLDAAEEDLTEAEENIRNLELRQSKGEIPLETYKKNIGDYQKRRDKAESTLNGILLRLREKIR